MPLLDGAEFVVEEPPSCCHHDPFVPLLEALRSCFLSLRIVISFQEGTFSPVFRSYTDTLIYINKGDTKNASF